jgi:predicted dehydrogenase
MMKVGIVGFGFMGRTHYRCWKALKNVGIAAICEVNPKTVKDTKKAIGNIGLTEDSIDLGRVELYNNLDKMLEKAELDAVSITLPTYLHADSSIKSLSAGVHVLCEKPMALNVEDCRRMIEAAEQTLHQSGTGQSGKILQIGHCVRFWPEYALTRDIIKSGKYGRVIAATFQRLGAAPAWSADNWLLNEQRSGGMALDLHIHDTDFVRYLFGMPYAVYSTGAKNAEGKLVHIVTQYLYDDDKVVTAEGGWSMTPAFGFQMSFNIALEKATILYDLTRKPTLRLFTADEEASAPEVPAGDGWSLEIEHFAGRIRGEKLEQIITPVESMDSVRIVEAEKKSAAKREKVVID